MKRWLAPWLATALLLAAATEAQERPDSLAAKRTETAICVR